MKKVLLATTALALSAGVAYAEVSISGSARMGLQYTGKVAGKAAAQGALTAAEVAAINTKYNLSGTTGPSAAIVANTAVTAAQAEALLASKASTATTYTGSLKTATENAMHGSSLLAATGVQPSTAPTGAAAATATAVAARKAAAIAAQDAAVIAAIAALEAAAATAAAADNVVVGHKAAADLAAAVADAAVGTAAVADTAATTKLEKQMTVTMSGSVETTSGLTFGASLNIRSNEGGSKIDVNENVGTGAANVSNESIGGAWISGARVYMSTGGVEVGVGNINGAIEYMPGVYSAGAGLTGLGWGGLVTNTSAKGYFNWDAYSSSGNGAEGVEVMYSAGSLSAHLSYSDTDLGSAGNRTAGYVAYTMGDWTVAAGMQDSTVNTEDKTVLTVGGKVGDYGVGIAYADNNGETKIALNGKATFGATTVSAYVANEESAANNPMGLGVSHDLGGAALKGGIAKTASGQTRADVGVSFSF